MKVLLIAYSDDVAERVREALERGSGEGRCEIAPYRTLEDSIEHLETAGESYGLLICEAPRLGVSLYAMLLKLAGETPCLFFVDHPGQLQKFTFTSRPSWLEIRDRDLGITEYLPRALERFRGEDTQKRADEEFVRYDVERMPLSFPVRADIYIRLGKGRYCRRFSKNDEFDSKDLAETFIRRGINAFYIRREDLNAVMVERSESLDRLSQGGGSRETVEEEVESSMQLVSDVVTRVGFTEEAQALAKKAVELTLKIIGNNPTMSDVLMRLKAKRGRYISSHSFMLAEVACAMAYQVGWKNPQMFLKLTTAALLHDLSLSDDRLARFQDLEEARKSGKWSEEELKELRLHPVRAAEYARGFNDLPADVDKIIEQHHERPDGSGFPRGLFHNNIHPLAALFIMAHDLLIYFLTHVPTGDRGDMVKLFFRKQARRYREGTFRKIAVSLRASPPGAG